MVQQVLKLCWASITFYDRVYVLLVQLALNEHSVSVGSNPFLSSDRMAGELVDDVQKFILAALFRASYTAHIICTLTHVKNL